MKAATIAVPRCDCGKPARVEISGKGPGVWRLCTKCAEVQRLIHGALLEYNTINAG